MSYESIDVDVTERRLRDQRLTVLHRILRHNLRNDLTVIEGHAQRLVSQLEDPDAKAAAEKIVDRTAALARISEKATTMNRLLQREYDTPPTCDLPTVLEEVSTSIQDRFAYASIGIDRQCETATAVVDPDMCRLAIEENDPRGSVVRLSLPAEER